MRSAVLCSTCLGPLRRGQCQVHGERNSDGSALRPSPRKGKRYPADVPNRQEVMALVDACSTRAPTGVRNAALIVVGYRAGLRVGELLALRPKDIDQRSRAISVLHGKGNKRRTVRIDSDALAYVGRWLQVREATGHRPVFCTLHGGQLSRGYVNEMLQRMARRAGVDRRIHAHGLRHAFAFELAMEGEPLPIISKALGHASIAATSRYIDHISAGELALKMRDRSGWSGA